MDPAGFNIMLRAISGEDNTDPSLFAHGVLHRLETELGVLRECLLSDDPDTAKAAHAVWAMQQRIDAAVDLIEQLRQRAKAGAQ